MGAAGTFYGIGAQSSIALAFDDAAWAKYGLGEYLGVPRQSSWNHGTMPNVDKWINEIATLSPVRPEGRLAGRRRPAGTGTGQGRR